MHPAHQGSGVGSALMLTCIEAARAAGEKIITVLGHPQYYPRFGFMPAAGCGVTCRLNNGPDDAKMVMSLDGAPIPPAKWGFAAR
ncbi:Predicted acetyltransferase [Serratia rubidaea]|uniref:Predicted acetyltransferase n=1 Tax=Serratia rubidaea TaxID=61652 RepID=A0A4U9HFS0_SERRU|nr:Predicted acetyltransferase [Serratia rubidaea]